MQIAEFVRVDPEDLRVFQFQQFLEGLEVDVVGAVDGLRGAEDGVGDGDTAAEEGGVFDVVDEEGGGVEHGYYLCDDLEGGGGDLQPCVEGGDKHFAEVFAWVFGHVVVGAQEDFFFLGRPGGLGEGGEAIILISWVIRRVRIGRVA